ncbi:hypothetical protein F2Q69_00044367 [Brassica cretica]|uniref:Uncharacterized protein n=1 Tax=Brassica cretica TaxID=69181 RepID=A0A8S9NG50_BRACR|nr:hypothetical protein F2Q69_00044367 [Brassica cretica]
MAPSFLSIAKFVEAILRRRFSSAGLSLQTLSIDSETTIQYWGPPPLETYRSRPSSSSTALAPPLYGNGTDRNVYRY